MSSPFHIPNNHLETFKQLCSDFSTRLPTKQPFFGAKLYNAFARALGYDSYNNLREASDRLDSKDLDDRFDLGTLFEILKLNLYSQICTELVLAANSEAKKTLPIDLPNQNDVITALRQAYAPIVITRTPNKCPLLSWDAPAYLFTGLLTGQLIDSPAELSLNGFALCVMGDSMHDTYPAGTYIFVDPDHEAVTGNDVIVKIKDGNTINFKRLTEDNNGSVYLTALNPLYNPSEPFDDEWMEIVGVVVAKADKL